MISQQNIAHIRVGLDEKGNAQYWPYDRQTDDYVKEPIEPAQALHLISVGEVPVVVACCDPYNPLPHNYESDAVKLRYI